MAHLSETIEIAATPETLYSMVSDLPRMGEWSPENRGARWVGRPKAPVRGARFVGVNRYKWFVWFAHGRIAVADPAREFAFEVRFGPIKVARWQYALIPSPGGVVVTESWTDRRPKLFARLLDALFGAPRESLNAYGIHQTLTRLKTSAERA